MNIIINCSMILAKEIPGKAETGKEKRTERVGIGTGTGRGRGTKIVIVTIETTTGTGVTEGIGYEIEMTIMTSTGVEIMTGDAT